MWERENGLRRFGPQAHPTPGVRQFEVKTKTRRAKKKCEREKKANEKQCIRCANEHKLKPKITNRHIIRFAVGVPLRIL